MCCVEEYCDMFINLFKSTQHVPGDKFAPSSEALSDCTYSFWYNETTVLPTGATVEMKVKCGTGRQHCRCIISKSCIYSQTVLLRMGEFVARNI